MQSPKGARPGTDPLVDVSALKPADAEVLQILADRLRVPLTRQWRRTLRWAGRALLVTRAEAMEAERILRAAEQVGVATEVRPSRRSNRLQRWITAHAAGLGRTAFVAATVGTFVKLFFFRGYNVVIHFLGLLWLFLVSRDMAVFEVVGRTAGIAASLVAGYIAMIFVHSALAWTRLAPALVAAARGDVSGDVASVPFRDILPVPKIQFFDWRRLRLVGVAAATVAALWYAATVVIHRYFRNDLPAALAALPEANRMQLPLPADPWKARDELQDRLRPAPDRRVVRALADVDRLVLGTPSVPRVEWVAGGWRVSVGPGLVGSLPATPSFADGLALLRSRVRQIAGGAHVQESSPSPFDGGTDDDALARLRQAQRSWPRGRPPDAAIVHIAANALALLSFHAIDDMSVGDALPARALAAMALDEETHGRADPALEALLAESMGYRRSARAAAVKLTVEDPIRLYVLREDDALARTAEAGPTWPRVLWLRRLGDLHRSEQAQAFRQEKLAGVPESIALLHQPLWQTEDVGGESIRAALPLVKAALDRERKAEGRQGMLELLSGPFRTRAHDELLLEAFERELNEIDAKGPLLDRDVVGAYYRGALYTGVRQAVHQMAEANGDPRSARDFMASLGRATEPPAQHLALWAQMYLPYASAYEFVQGKPGAEVLAASLQLGPDAVEDALRHAD